MTASTPEAIFAFVTLASRIFTVVTESAASLAAVTLESRILEVITESAASLAEVIPKSLTRRASALISIVELSTLTAKSSTSSALGFVILLDKPEPAVMEASR